MRDAALLVDPTIVAGTWYRHIRHIEGAPTDPLWRAPSRDGAARWQRDRIVRALYLADSVETMWAEWYRHLAEAALEPSDALPREVWGFEIALPGAANLSTPQRIRRTGLPWPIRPVRKTWPACQDVGHRLHAAGYSGLLTISAARSGRLAAIPSASSGAMTPPNRHGSYRPNWSRFNVLRRHRHEGSPHSCRSVCAECTQTQITFVAAGPHVPGLEKRAIYSGRSRNALAWAGGTTVKWR